ncbi:MAG: hypothetical protein Q8N88_00425, partial [Nanoarchaeota archaeon]|nr:hypothetical protein [Nanoarchaeota archaeon]
MKKLIIKLFKKINLLTEKYSLWLIIVLLLFSSLVKIHRFQTSYIKVIQSADIRYTWEDSVNLARGEKIYNRILEGDLINNQKYPDYWPFIYQLTAFFYQLGGNLVQYAFFTLLLNLVLESITTVVIFRQFLKVDKALEGLFFCFIFLINNYNFFVNGTLQLDIIIVCLLIISLLNLKQKPILASLLYGLSLSIKQFGFFILPIYFFYKTNLKNKIKIIIMIVLVPFITALPFIISQPKGFFTSMIFELIRKSDRPGGYALGFFGDVGFLSRLPLFAAYAAMVYLY